MNGKAAFILVLFALALAVAGCANDETAPPNDSGPRGGAGGTSAIESADIASTGSENEPMGPDLLGFPEVAGVTSRDYSYVESTGALKGYVTKFYKIRHVQGTKLIAILSNWKSAQGRIVDDPDHNTIILTDLKEVMDTYDRVLTQIDRLPAQIEVEAKVIEITRSNNYEFGFELHVDRTPASNSAFRTFDGVFNSPSFIDSLRSGASPFQGAAMDWAAVGKAEQILGDFNYELRALEQDGYAEILSAPRVVVDSGHKATLIARNQEPVLVTNIVNNSLQQITTQFQPVGVTLEVTPVVIGTDAILLDVKPSVSSVISFVTDATTGVSFPRIAERTVDTEVNLRNGEILVLGGLYQKQHTENTNTIPIIGKIPFIGRLFSEVDEQDTKTDIIFVLRLRILTNLEEANERLRRIPGGLDEEESPASGR